MNSPTVMEGTGRDEEDDENGDSYYDEDENCDFEYDGDDHN